MGVGQASWADSTDPIAPESAAAKSSVVSVSGGLAGTVEVSRRGSFAPHNASYIGMTRTRERERIASIDPTDWLGRFGAVVASEQAN